MEEIRNEGEQLGVGPFQAHGAVPVSAWGNAPGIEQEGLLSPKGAILMEFNMISAAPLGLE